MTSPSLDSSNDSKWSLTTKGSIAIIVIYGLLDWLAVPTPGAKDWRELLPQNTTVAPALTSVSVSKEHQKPSPCPEADGKFQCDKPSWAYVGTKRDMTVAGKKETCTWAHPLAKRTLHITHAPLSLNAGETLLLETALDDRAVSGRGGAVDVAVLAGGEKIARHTQRDRRGWQTLEIKGPREGALVLEVSAKNTGRRHFCYRLRQK